MSSRGRSRLSGNYGAVSYMRDIKKRERRKNTRTPFTVGSHICHIPYVYCKAAAATEASFNYSPSWDTRGDVSPWLWAPSHAIERGTHILTRPIHGLPARENRKIHIPRRLLRNAEDPFVSARVRESETWHSFFSAVVMKGLADAVWY